ncbi:type II toxin-antitoxin system Phd/YefM family antitoxin [Phytomonospora sp. NPDC050363]|uniref:type II toxin-antitoxin system Phd/YefM family antitoxin n=1 Tax=Phytomonospora sp. NPDC050363 TaxID=3155642 RepID=UPI0033FD3E8E
METLPLAEVRNRLSELVNSVELTHERVTVTKNGRPAAVLISPEDLERLEETIAVLSDPQTMQDLAESQQAIERGELYDAADLAEIMAARVKDEDG